MDAPAPQEKDGSCAAPNLPASSLIICSRNRPKLLFECVSSIFQGEELPTELLIIDDSDSPHERLGSMRTVRGCEIRYLWTHSVGLSRANNDGISTARHDVLVFTQDDVLVTPTWFGTIVKALIEGSQPSVVTGQVLPDKPETSGGFAPSTTADPVPAVYEGRIKKDVLFVQNMAMYRNVVEQVGYFDQGLGPGTPFPAAEDNDFGLRLLEGGYRILYVPQAVVYHRAWRATCDYIPLQWNYGRGQGAYYAKYLSLRDRYMLQRMTMDILSYLYRVPRRLWHAQPYQLLGDTTFIFGILLGAAGWLWMKRRAR